MIECVNIIDHSLMIFSIVPKSTVFSAIYDDFQSEKYTKSIVVNNSFGE